MFLLGSSTLVTSEPEDFARLLVGDLAQTVDLRGLYGNVATNFHHRFHRPPRLTREDRVGEQVHVRHEESSIWECAT